MTLARSLGVSVRRWLGWEPAEVTTFHYDDDGRVQAVITVREPEFSDLDRSWIRRSYQQEHEHRGDHGIPLSEATDPNNMGRYKLGMPTTDFAAKARYEGLQRAKKEYGEEAMNWLLFRVEQD